jgi:hypothetical protein
MLPSFFQFVFEKFKSRAVAWLTHPCQSPFVISGSHINIWLPVSLPPLKFELPYYWLHEIENYKFHIKFSTVPSNGSCDRMGPAELFSRKKGKVIDTGEMLCAFNWITIHGKITVRNAQEANSYVDEIWVSLPPKLSRTNQLGMNDRHTCK